VGAVTKVSKETLHKSSIQHISDVRKGINFIRELLNTAADKHDFDKLTDLDSFHSDFIGGFKNTVWWDKHRLINRHHLLQADGIRDDVNLVDVIDMIVDCVMAGMGRTGTVYPVEISMDVLKRAFDNTVNLLKNNVVVENGKRVNNEARN
jgi:protein tyrosine phosphatase